MNAQEDINKLVDQGFDSLDQEDFEGALELGKQLREYRHSAAFEIGGLAYAALGKVDQAIAYLQDGVLRAPEAWPNWQLLGNYLSDMERYDEAHKAYFNALKCEAVWRDSIYLNQAILLNRMGRYSKSLSVLEKIHDNELSFRKRDVALQSLIALGLDEKAENLAHKALGIPDYSAEEGVVLARIAAQLANLKLRQGKSSSEVRTFIFNSFAYDENSRQLMALVREMDNLYSDKAKYYRTLIHCKLAETSQFYGDAIGYYRYYDVIAESEKKLLEFVVEFENHDHHGGYYSVEECEILEQQTRDPCGVYWRSEDRHLYSHDDQDSSPDIVL